MIHKANTAPSPTVACPPCWKCSMAQPSYQVGGTSPFFSKHITWHTQYSLSYQNVIKQEIWHERNNVWIL